MQFLALTGSRILRVCSLGIRDRNNLREKFSVFGRWIIFCKQAYKMFLKADRVIFVRSLGQKT
jgi:hypothetical protein